jgi:GGDEF domain-containing protein
MPHVETGFDPLTLVGSVEGTRWATFVWASRGPFAAIGIRLASLDALRGAHGDDAGDELLQAVVRRIGATIPPIPDGYVGRIEDATFLALVATPDAREAAHLARRIHEAIAAPLPIGISTVEPETRLVVVPVRVGPATRMALPGLPSSWSIGGKERTDLQALVREALDGMPVDGDPIVVLAHA